MRLTRTVTVGLALGAAMRLAAAPTEQPDWSVKGGGLQGGFRPYVAAPRNDGCVLMPNEVEAYRVGPNAFEFKGTNGFPSQWTSTRTTRCLGRRDR
jgi:hypothetical protein